MNSTTFQFITDLSRVMVDPECLAELGPAQLASIRKTADTVLAEAPFPITASTLYAMNYGVLLNLAAARSNPAVAFFAALTGHKPEDDQAEETFLLVLAELARRVLAGEIPPPVEVDS